MKTKRQDRAWFERKVSELGEAIKQLPDERQLELFDELDDRGESDRKTPAKSERVKAAVDAFAPPESDRS